MNAYTLAKDRYAALGVDTEGVLNTLKDVTVSVHCWQGDDVVGFDAKEALSGGIQTTGNYPGKATTPEQLMADFGATQEELAKRIARSRPQIANTLRLLKLPPSVQKKVAAQVITAGHARALLSLDTAEDMERLSERIVAEGLSVRTTEEIVRVGKVKATPRPRARKQEPLSALGESVVTALSDAYDTRVSITEGQKKGRIVIEFAGADDLQRIADLILH